MESHDKSFGQKYRLAAQLAKREILSRYRGSFLGLVWSMITPLFLLGIYTFVFGVVFKSRWISSDTPTSAGEFSVILFTGLIIFQLLADTVVRAPNLMLENATFVKKVIFPLEILVPVAFATALFHAVVSFAILIPFIFIVFGDVPITAVLVPIALFPFMLLVIGLGWTLAAAGVFLRDIGQFVGTAVTALLFLAPIFFPRSALPDWLTEWLFLNPLTVPVNQTRELVIFGRVPDFGDYLVYFGVAALIFVFGFSVFQKMRKGFADVL